MSLFKYIPPERVDILENGRIRVTPSTERNDPFDERPFAEMITERSARAAGKKQKLTGGQLDDFVAWFIDRKDELNAKGTNDLPTRNAGSWGAICFSRRWDSIPMWSYYAKEHRGMVLEFNEKDPEFKELFGARARITYGTRGVVRGKSKGKARAFFRKAPAWKHEQEERVMFPFSRCSTGAYRIHLASYPSRSLISLYLGCRIDPCLRAYILDHLSAWKLAHLRVIQLHPETKRFGFFPERVRG